MGMIPATMTLRAQPPFYVGRKSYPQRWWRKMPTHFFPRWSPHWDTPRPWDYDHWFDVLPWQISDLLEPDILPHPVETPPEHPCAALYLGVIQQAFLDVQQRNAKVGRFHNAAQLAREAYDWLTDLDNQELCSLSQYCQHLRIEPTWIKALCLRLPKPAEPAPTWTPEKCEEHSRKVSEGLRKRRERLADIPPRVGKFAVPGPTTSLDHHSLFAAGRARDLGQRDTAHWCTCRHHQLMHTLEWGCDHPLCDCARFVPYRTPTKGASTPTQEDAE